MSIHALSRTSLSILGSLTLVLSTATAQHRIYRSTGTPTASSHGILVAGVGDMNLDGYADYAVGETKAITVYSGQDGMPIRKFDVGVNGVNLQLGRSSIAGAGRVDTDPFTDLIVGLPTAGVSQNSREGFVLVFSGKWIVHGRGPALLHRLHGARGDEIGNAVDGADLDGDGLSELIVAAPQGGTAKGYIRVFSETARERYTISGAINTSLGWVTAIGDVNRDGFRDMIGIGAHVGSKLGSLGDAAVYSGRDGTVLHRVLAPTYQSGTYAGDVGDLDKDGYSDYVVTVVPVALPSHVRVFSGRNQKLLLNTASLGVGVGVDPRVVGDVDGDSYPDFLLNQSWSGSGSTRMRIMSGHTLKELVGLPSGPTKRAEANWTVVDALGDANGDGIPDLVVGNYSEVQVLSCRPLRLESDTQSVSITRGGTQELTLWTGPSNTPAGYFLLGSSSGVNRGTAITSIRVPLNRDSYFDFTWNYPNTAIRNSLGSLTRNTAHHTARLHVPPRLPASLIGTRLHHAYVLFDLNPLRVRAPSNPVVLTLVQ